MRSIGLTRLSLHNGVYEAAVTGLSEDALGFEAVVADQVIARAQAVLGKDGVHLLRVELPAHLIGSQPHIVDIRSEAGVSLDRFAVMTDAQVAGDLRAELDLLRAEFDLLKAAFRRHCSDTGAD